MAYVVPNSFSNGDELDAGDVQENNRDLQKYLQGEMVSNDVSSLTNWMGPKHIMKGLYFPLTNEYEMESCLSKGVPVFPQYHPSYAGQQLMDIGGSERQVIPTMGIDFYLEEDATCYLYYTVSPRVMCPTGQTATYEKTDVKQFIMSTRINGSTIQTSQAYWPELFGPTVGFERSMVSPYRRRNFSFQHVFDGNKGANTIDFVCQSGAISVALKFFNFTLQAFY